MFGLTTCALDDSVAVSTRFTVVFVEQLCSWGSALVGGEILYWFLVVTLDAGLHGRTPLILYVWVQMPKTAIIYVDGGRDYTRHSGGELVELKIIDGALVHSL